MLTPTAIFHQPTFIFFSTLSSISRPPKPFVFSQIPFSKSIFSGGIFSKNKEHRVPGSITMTELIRSSSSRSSNGDEGFRVLEQEALIDGPSEIIVAGFQSTLNRLSKWLVSAFFGAVLLCRHDVESLWAAMGSVVNAALSVILKRILNQERPVSTLKSGPGMPSSHAQSILFSVIFAILSMVEWLGTNALTLTVSGLILAFGSYLSWLRVMEKYHTISQVVVGAVVGCIFSILWFWSWKAFVLEAFVSYLWVKFVVVTGAVGFCVGFIFYVIRYWLKNE